MKKILVHVHIFYENLYPELKACLLNLKDYNCDYIFTFVKENKTLESDIKSTFLNAKYLNSTYVTTDTANIEINCDKYTFFIANRTSNSRIKTFNK